MTTGLQIRPADDRRSRKRFADLPFRLYRDDPIWVPPLRSAQNKLLAQKTAFFNRNEMQLFLAERDGRVVGRIAAILNRAHNAHYGDRVGFFGFFECEPDDAAAAVDLLAAAERWLGERGCDAIRGPVSPSLNAEAGLLIDGFDWPPMPLMPHSLPAYPAMVEAAGLTKCMDLLAYRIDRARCAPGEEGRDRLARMAALLRRRHKDVTVRPIDMSNFAAEVVKFMGVFDQARSENWGYVPVTEAELQETAAELRQVIQPDLVLMAEVDGEPAGAVMGLPNFNIALKKINGRLLPLGWWTLMRTMKKVDQMRMFGAAALPRFRHRGITALLFLEIIERAWNLGYQIAEASWVLEDNQLSDGTIRAAFNPTLYKTYRIYEKPVSGSAPA